LSTKQILRQRYVCPKCRIPNCRKHCYNPNCAKEIGTEIIWQFDSISGKWYLADEGTGLKHECLKKGQGFYIKDGQLGKPILNDLTRKLLYKPLSAWEKKQITLGRLHNQQLFYNDDFYRSRHIESKI
jgi:hypothetical protein